jgi:hypothetical protein
MRCASITLRADTAASKEPSSVEIIQQVASSPEGMQVSNE